MTAAHATRPVVVTGHHDWQMKTEGMMEHIVLPGDSILDNAPYVPAGRDVTSRLRSLLDTRHRVSLLAGTAAYLKT